MGRRRRILGVVRVTHKDLLHGERMRLGWRCRKEGKCGREGVWVCGVRSMTLWMMTPSELVQECQGKKDTTSGQ